MTRRQTFSKEFKLEAVRMLEAGDKNGTEIALQLGVRKSIK